MSQFIHIYTGKIEDYSNISLLTTSTEIAQIFIKIHQLSEDSEKDIARWLRLNSDQTKPKHFST